MFSDTLDEIPSPKSIIIILLLSLVRYFLFCKGSTHRAHTEYTNSFNNKTIMGTDSGASTADRVEETIMHCIQQTEKKYRNHQTIAYKQTGNCNRKTQSRNPGACSSPKHEAEGIHGKVYNNSGRDRLN